MGSCQSRRNGAVAEAHGNLAAGKRRQLLRRLAHLGGCQVHAEAVVGPSTPADNDGKHSHAFHGVFRAIACSHTWWCCHVYSPSSTALDAHAVPKQRHLAQKQASTLPMCQES